MGVGGETEKGSRQLVELGFDLRSLVTFDHLCGTSGNAYILVCQQKWPWSVCSSKRGPHWELHPTAAAGCEQCLIIPLGVELPLTEPAVLPTVPQATG